MKFEEPKVEFLHINANEVVFASNGAGGVTTCIESGGPNDCTDLLTMFDQLEY